MTRSSSNHTSFESPDNFYHGTNESEMNESTLIPSYRRHSATSVANTTPYSFVRSINFNDSTMYRKSQISCSTTETDDDGYGSLVCSNDILSRSPSSCVTSEFSEILPDNQYESSPST